MKSRSNNSNKAEKQRFEKKQSKRLNYISLDTGCDLCLQGLNYKSTEKYSKKTKLINPNLFLKTNIFKTQKRLRTTTKRNG